LDPDTTFREPAVAVRRSFALRVVTSLHRLVPAGLAALLAVLLLARPAAARPVRGVVMTQGTGDPVAGALATPVPARRGPSSAASDRVGSDTPM
jgi:hypothetical protein